MKQIIFVMTVILFGSLNASAVTELCASKALKAAEKQASRDRSGRVIVSYFSPNVVSQEMKGGRLITVYEISLEHCDPDDTEECGSLTYEVVTAATGNTCTVLRTDMTGEE